jgi:UDP-glucose 4-epimerase
MKLLVTGGSGLVGRYIVDELCRSNDVEVLDLKPPHRKDVPHLPVDVLDLSALQRVVHGYDAVIHLAGIPHPLNDPPEKVFRVNTLGTFNILEACAGGGIPKLVFMSSESTLGFAFSTTRLTPLYLPVDENHVLRPQDPYGLSKVACELLCRGYSERSGINTVSLRAPWIWVPEQKERSMYRHLIDEYPKWYKNLWAFIHVNDVAQAVALAIVTDLKPKHDVFFISADNNWTGKDSRELAGKFFSETHEFRSDFSGTSSFISSNKAKAVLKFNPHHTALDVFA